jgi:hypothetical protein
MTAIILLSIILLGILIIICQLVVRKESDRDFMIATILSKIDSNKSVDVFSLFHPKVWEIYQEYINNPESWRTAHCFITNGIDSVWSENGISNRTFYGKQYEGINEKLTHYDQLVLDKIVWAVKNREKLIGLKISIL